MGKLIQPRYNFEISSPNDIPAQYSGLDFGLIEGLHASRFNLGNMPVFILEPDQLVSVTSAAKYGLKFNFLEFLAYEFVGSIVMSEAIIVGNVVGSVIEDYISKGGSLDIRDAIDSHLSRYSLDFIALGLSKAKVVERIDLHVKNLVKWLSGRDLSGIYCEMEFISPRFGLRGRSDISFSEGGSKWGILDIKTSKPPKSGQPYDSHAQQVLGYALCAMTSLGRSSGTLGMLYSASQSPQYDFAPTSANIEKFIYSRNIIAYNSALIASGRISELFDLVADGGYNSPPYLSESVSVIKKSIEHIRRASTSSGVVDEISSRLAFLEREKRSVYVEFSSMWRMPQEVRASSGRSSGRLVLSSLDGRSLVLSGSLEGASFKAGDRVLLLVAGNSGGLRSTIFSITIEKIEYGAADLLYANITTNNKGLVLGGEYIIEYDASPSMLHVCQKAIMVFFSSNAPKVALYFGDSSPRVYKDYNREVSYDLNSSQKDAILGVRMARDCFLVQGPPGSGKTHFLASLLEDLVSSGETVLFSAFTNTAIDNALSRYTGDGVVRLSGSRLPDGVSPKDVESAQVIAGTAYGLMFNKIFAVMSPSILVVDEASQLLDEHILFLLSRVSRVVMVGDHMQMPPIVQSDKGYNYSVSIFERVFERFKASGKEKSFKVLEEQYRMTPAISDFISESFYGGRLTSNVEPGPGDGIYFGDTRGVMVSKTNLPEQKRVVELVRSLLREFKPSDIGVISPFRAQNSALRALLSDFVQGVEVDTVERYQGREKEVVVYSPVVSGSMDMVSPSSLDMPDKKFNVAVSRAKKRFYMLGDKETLSQRPEYLSFINRAIVYSP